MTDSADDLSYLDYYDPDERYEYKDSSVSGVFDNGTLYVKFTGTKNTTDYGVAFSPIFYEVDDVQIEELTLLSIKIDPFILPSDVQDAIIDLHHEIEWE